GSISKPAIGAVPTVRVNKQLVIFIFLPATIDVPLRLLSSHCTLSITPLIHPSEYTLGVELSPVMYIPSPQHSFTIPFRMSKLLTSDRPMPIPHSPPLPK